MIAAMGTFAARSTELEQLLHKRQSDEGGWPQKLELDEAPTTIVATAQALEILRIRGLEFRDDQVQQGLRHLAEQVVEQTSPRRGAGRGESTRFPAYALWGLLRYPQSIHDDALRGGIKFAYDWLRSNALPAGGWSRSKDPDGQLWLPGTMVAVHALERLGLYGGRVIDQDVEGLVQRARNHLAEQAQRASSGRMYWTQVVGGAECPGATSLAVLTLARGSQDHREVARAGIEWLAANRAKWTRHTHIDNLIDRRIWRIHSSSLGLRALMHPCGERDVSDPAVVEVVSHFDSLWRAGKHGWADEAGLEATVSGSYAVISAVHTIKRVWPFDPFEQLGVETRHSSEADTRPPRAHRLMYLSVADQAIRIEDNAGSLILQTKLAGRSQWRFVLLVAQRHHDAVAKGVKNQTERTVSLEECAYSLETKPESVIRMRRRLNEKLAREARKRSHRAFLELIEDHVPPETTELRFALEEIDVSFVDELPSVQRMVGDVSSGQRKTRVADGDRTRPAGSGVTAAAG